MVFSAESGVFDVLVDEGFFFPEKGDLFLLEINKARGRGPEIAKIIRDILKRYGVEGDRILDTCCGNGRIAMNLARLGYKVYGIDISKRCARDAEEKATEHGVADSVRLLVGDVRELTKFFPPNYFDAILNMWTSIGYYSDDFKMFGGGYEAGREGGMFIVAGCVSRDNLLNFFCSKLFEEFEELVVLHYNDFASNGIKAQGKMNVLHTPRKHSRISPKKGPRKRK